MCIKCRLIQLSVNLDDLEPELRRIAKLMYEGKLEPGQIDAAMVKRIADQLMKGVLKGYGSLTDLSPAQRSFITQLQENVYVFSGFKNYQQLKEASLLLLDNQGSYKSFNEFLNDVKKINETYNQVYLEAEYNNAISSAQNARAWQDFVENGVDMLQFQTAEDDRVREDHAILNGIIVPIGDPLLDKYFTPLDWGCRCEWIPAPGEKPTGYSQQELPPLKPMFSTNIGKTGVIFPDTHPYFDAPKQIADKIIEQVSTIEKTTILPEQVKGLSNYEQDAGITVDKTIFSMLKKDTPIVNTRGGACYVPVKNEVRLPVDSRAKKSKWHAERVVYHEFGHAIDWHNSLRLAPEVQDLMSKYKKVYRGRFPTLHAELKREAMDAFVSGNADQKEQVTALADTVMSLNKAYGWGHTKRYFNSPGMKEAEFIAHAFENKFIGNSVFKRLMPELYEDMINLVDGYIKLK